MKLRRKPIIGVNKLNYITGLETEARKLCYSDVRRCECDCDYNYNSREAEYSLIACVTK